MTAPTIQLFVTPVAGLLARVRLGRLRRALTAGGARVIVAEGGFQPLTIDARADRVCAVGGDGTLRHVIDAVRRSGRCPGVSVYPAGTVNLTAMEQGYPKAASAFARRVLNGAPRSRYLATVDGLPILACASIGPDSRAVAAVSPALKRWFGRYAYVLAFLLILVRWPRTKLLVRYDGEAIACEAVYIAKGPYFAGRWSFAPHASGLDALLHVVALPTASRRAFLRFAWALARNRAAGLAGVHRFSCRALTIDSAPGVPLQGDGDILTQLPATITIDPEPIRFA